MRHNIQLHSVYLEFEGWDPAQRNSSLANPSCDIKRSAIGFDFIICLCPI